MKNHRIYRFFCFILFVGSLHEVSSQTADELYREARRAYTTEVWDKANSLFTRFLRDYPDDSRGDSATYLVAVSYYNDKKYHQCLNVLSRFSDTYPDSPWNRRIAWWEGISRYALGDWKAASLAFERQSKILEEAIYGQRSLVYLASCYDELQEWTLAEKTYITIIETVNDYEVVSNAIFRLGRIKLINGQAHEALDEFSRLAYRYSSAKVARGIEYWLAESYRAIGEREKALSSYIDFLSKVYESPNRSHALLEASRISVDMRRYEEALAYLDLRQKELDSLNDSHTDEILRIRASSWLGSGNLSKARNALIAITKKTKDAGERQSVFFQLAGTWMNTGNTVKVLSYLKQSAKGPNPAIAADSLYLAALISFQDNQTIAAQYIEQFTRKFPEDRRRVKSLEMSVYVWIKNNKPSKAIADLDILIREYPRLDLYFLLRGQLLFSEGYVRKALQDVLMFTRRYRGSAYLYQAYFLMGVIYDALGEYLDAAESYTQSAELIKDGLQESLKQQALYFSGIAYRNGNSLEQAVNIFSVLSKKGISRGIRAESTFQLAESLYLMEDYAAARDAYVMSLNFDEVPWEYDVFLGIGKTWMRESHQVEAEKAFELASQVVGNRDDGVLYEDKIDLVLDTLWEDMLLSYEDLQSEKIDLISTELLYQKILLMITLGRMDEAKQLVQQITIDSDSYTSSLMLSIASAFHKFGEFHQAVILYEQWFDVNFQEIPDFINSDDLHDTGLMGVIESWSEALVDAKEPSLAMRSVEIIREKLENNRVLSMPIVLAWIRISHASPEILELLREIIDDKTLPDNYRDEAEELLEQVLES